MIDLELPPLPQQKVSLQLESDLRTAGRRTGWRITLGGPIAARVTPTYVARDADLQLFVEQEAAHNITSHTFAQLRGSAALRHSRRQRWN